MLFDEDKRKQVSEEMKKKLAYQKIVEAKALLALGLVNLPVLVSIISFIVCLTISSPLGH